MVLEIFFAGIITALGWWTGNHYIIEPYFPDPIVKEKKADASGASKD
jgi:hypothetical protein